jgi:hypothetical protein
MCDSGRKGVFGSAREIPEEEITRGTLKMSRIVVDRSRSVWLAGWLAIDRSIDR